jgi:hypothetical protein
MELAPAVGFEPTTNRLTADRSTTELRWIFLLRGLRSVNLARAIYNGKCFLAHKKIAAENSGHHSRIVATKIGCGGGI